MVQTERRPSQVVTFGSPFGYHQTTVTNIPTRKTSRKRSIPTQSSVISAKKCSVVYRVPIQLEWQPQKVWITTTKAESFYNVNYGSSIIMSKSSSKNLSNQNKHSCFCCLQDKMWIIIPKWTFFEVSFLWKHQSLCFH